MISFEQALDLVLNSVTEPSSVESVALEDCLGRYSAEAVIASINVPGFANSAMDGYAVRVAELEMNSPMPVSQRIAAGENPLPLQPGSVARIFTGAKIPAGADAVLLQEDTCIESGGAVCFSELPELNQHIRPAGQDVARGSQLITAGKRLNAADLGLAASVGLAKLDCRKPLRVAFFSTGDELRQPGEPLSGAQIYNSNRFLLAGCIQELGMLPVDLGCCEDNAEATRQILMQASGQADCILTTGGMSVGEEDYVRTEAEALGELEFWKIAMKPGKPFAQGVINGTPFFGLPGNPVSTYVTFQLLVKPWLLKTMGAGYLPKRQMAIAQFDRGNRGKRLDFLRARVDSNAEGVLEVSVYDNQSSGVLSSIVYANALLPVAAYTNVAKGEQVEIWLLDQTELKRFT